VAYHSYRQAAREHERAGRTDAAWACLEAAHIVCQRATRWHVAAHVAMFGLAWRTREVAELLGQSVRVVAAALFTWVWVPRGNSGRADVSAVRIAPVPRDLQVPLSSEGNAACVTTSMDTHCCASDCTASKMPISTRYRRVLQIALLANVCMFAVEIVAGLRADSVSLLADAIDFAGDAANYGLSLAVLSLAVVWRSRAALIKGLSMGAYGTFIIAHAAWNILSGSVPDHQTMGLIGVLALCVNVGVAYMLFSFREGDANTRSVWLCSRNDAIGNVAVIAAAVLVGWFGTGWPDVLVALIMGSLALVASLSVVQQARRELLAVGADPAESLPLASDVGAHSADRAVRGPAGLRR